MIELRKNDILKKLQELFLFDFNHELWGVLDQNLVVSPYNSREKLEYLLNSAEKSIDFYFPYLQDDWLEKILFEASESWVSIRGIVDKSFYEENQELIEKYKQRWIILSPLRKDKLHAKMILVDKTYMYVWSINFSRYSMDENRELGIILRDISLIKKMKEIFQDDF
jgi:phosphatidylserine/phosphatidylglycerophosphate/cardiolipin synthase-like enzyme